MWNLFMGNSESATSDEDESKSMEEEQVRVFQPQKLRQELENVVKHRIPSPTREAGDGMEASKASSTKSSPPQDSVKLFKLPKTNISLEKLPPITDDKVTLPITEPTSPLVLLSTGQPAVKNPVFHNAKKAPKEPKFVPYEPYKAAITPLVPTHDKKKKNSAKGSKIPAPPSAEKIQEKAVEILEEKRNLDHEREVHELKTKLDEAQKQLRIQIQVNNEVKKLLVASVGEDIEAKVDYLTQDKARLSADICQYSNKISRDFEEKEKLSIESDLWKSKFLASSVIVDELAHWKGALMQRSNDCDHYIRLLFHERSVLWNSMLETQEVLERLKNAFDPLNTMENSLTRKKVEAASMIGLADLSLATVQDLKNRLLGTTQLKTYENKPVTLPNQLDSPAEEGLKSIISTPAANLSISNLSDTASSALAGAARPHLQKMGDQAASAKHDFKCCTHCQGSIHVV